MMRNNCIIDSLYRMLAVFFITTLLTSLLTGVGFAFLIVSLASSHHPIILMALIITCINCNFAPQILADICVGLSTITDDPQCMQQVCCIVAQMLTVLAS